MEKSEKLKKVYLSKFVIKKFKLDKLVFKFLDYDYIDSNIPQFIKRHFNNPQSKNCTPIRNPKVVQTPRHTRNRNTAFSPPKSQKKTKRSRLGAKFRQVGILAKFLNFTKMKTPHKSSLKNKEHYINHSARQSRRSSLKLDPSKLPFGKNGGLLDVAKPDKKRARRKSHFGRALMIPPLKAENEPNKSTFKPVE